MNIYKIIIAIGCLQTTLACAQTKSPESKTIQLPLPLEIKDWSWTKKDWKGDSTPYIKVKNSIDNAFKAPSEIEKITQRYRSAAIASPSNALAQYAWGYSAYAGRPLGYPVNGRELPEIASALGKPKDPSTYEYARLRFVITARYRPFIELKSLGKRLLTKDKDDYDVKSRLIDMLVVGTRKEREQALIYANEMVKAQPKLPSAYSALAWARHFLFFSNKDVNMGNNAIAAYRKFISMSKSPEAKSQAKIAIDSIQKRMALIKNKH